MNSEGQNLIDLHTPEVVTVASDKMQVLRRRRVRSAVGSSVFLCVALVLTTIWFYVENQKTTNIATENATDTLASNETTVVTPAVSSSTEAAAPKTDAAETNTAKPAAKTSTNKTSSADNTPAADVSNTPSAAPAPSTTYHGVLCSVDANQAPDLANLVETFGGVCEKEYPKLIAALAGQSKVVQLTFKPGMQNAAETLGTNVSLSSSYFANNPSDTGAVVHELAHVAQAYPGGTAFWLTEGIADYYRYSLGYANSWSYAHCGSGSERYTSGYWCSAAFLTYVKRVYSDGIISTANSAQRTGEYPEDVFYEATGKTLDELWVGCLEAECRGGTA